jgi:Hemopexin
MSSHELDVTVREAQRDSLSYRILHHRKEGCDQVRNWLGIVIREVCYDRTINGFVPRALEMMEDAIGLVCDELAKQEFLEESLKQCSQDAAVSQLYLPSGEQVKIWEDHVRYTRAQFASLASHHLPDLTVYARDLARPDGRRAVGNAQFTPPLVRAADDSVTGLFEIRLDDRIINEQSRENFQEPVRLIGSYMVHEMLHNLGHSHTADYTDGAFMNVFQDIFYHNGEYKPSESSFRLTGTPDCAAGSESALLGMPVIEAAIEHPNGKTYFFCGGKYRRFDFDKDRVDKIGVVGRDGWEGIWDDGMDAATMHPNGRAYFFKGDKYRRFDFNADKVDKEGRIGIDGWSGLWASGLSAAMLHPNGKAYFFRGNRYQRFDFGANKVNKEGTIGTSGWHGLWSDGIDAATLHPNGKAYFFRGRRYRRYVFDIEDVDKEGIVGVSGWTDL